VKLILLFFLFLPFLCLAQAPNFDYGTKSAEAREAYLRGWEEILDLGEWTKAEASYREAVKLDPEFQLAWAQVGRISNDPAERTSIYTKLKPIEADSTWESRLLEVYLGSLQLIDSKDRGIAIQPEQVSHFYEISFQNFGEFLNSYPGETYIRAEYLEVIHAIQGAVAALDSIQAQENLGIESSPFLISYKSQLWAELKDFGKAAEALEDLKNSLSGTKVPAISFTEAILNFEKEDWSQAEKFVDQTLFLDPKHTLAKRLKSQIQDRLKN
jgi:tetratricopeptide (TPR) repeat protein